MLERVRRWVERLERHESSPAQLRRAPVRGRLPGCAASQTCREDQVVCRVCEATHRGSIDRSVTVGLSEQEEPVHGLWFHSWRDGISLDLVGERALVWCRPAVLLAHRRLKVIGCLWFDVLSLGVAVLSGVDLARTLRQKPRPHHQM